MIGVLQILVSVIFFTNKVLILADKKVGWLFGAVAATLGVFYCYAIGLYIYTVLEVGLIILMGYGFLKKDRRNPRAEMWMRLVTSVVMIAFTYFAFSGLMTLVELSSSTGLLWGTFLLTSGKKRIGWIIYTVAHLLTAYLAYHKGQQFFADLQIASALVSIVGFSKKS